MWQFLGLDDPTGVNDPAFEVGVINGTPIPGAGYNGNADLDWWYAADKTQIDAQRLAIDRLTASLAGNVLTAGPGAARVGLTIGQTSLFDLSSVRLGVTTGITNVPGSSTGNPPGHMAFEHLDPALATFAAAGTSLAPGTMCANVSAYSLAHTPIAPALVGGACGTQNYTAGNSMLDLLVSGCRTGLNITTAVQPDQTDPAQPPAGAGPPYTLAANATTHVVDTCRDSGNAVVDLDTCLRDAAFSVYFKYTTDRVIAGDNQMLKDSFDSGDMSAWTGAQTDGGDLSVDPSAQLAGATAHGLLGNINDTTGLYVEDTRPDNEDRYRASFWFDPTGFDPGEALLHRRVRLFILFEDGPRRLVAIVLRRIGGQYAIQARVRLDDNTQVNTPFTDITAGPHRVEFDWVRSSGPDANDGRFTFTLDATTPVTLAGLDNSLSSVDFVRLGALSVKVGAGGTLKWDEFEANRMSATAP
jgi:hypothetical protein